MESLPSLRNDRSIQSVVQNDIDSVPLPDCFCLDKPLCKADNDEDVSTKSEQTDYQVQDDIMVEKTSQIYEEETAIICESVPTPGYISLLTEQHSVTPGDIPLLNTQHSVTHEEPFDPEEYIILSAEDFTDEQPAASDSLAGEQTKIHPQKLVGAAKNVLKSAANVANQALGSTYCTAKDVFYTLQARNQRVENVTTNSNDSADTLDEEISPVQDDQLQTHHPKPVNTVCKFVKSAAGMVNHAATTTYSTAKEVFYTLQTRNQKDPSDTRDKMASERNEEKHAIQTDSMLEVDKQEIQRRAMQHLLEMGFFNADLNKQLLEEYEYDTEKVIQELLAIDDDYQQI